MWLQSKSIYIPVPSRFRGDQLFLYRRAFAPFAVMQKKSRQSRTRVKKQKKGRNEARSERRMVQLCKYRLYNGFTARSRTSVISSSIV